MFVTVNTRYIIPCTYDTEELVVIHASLITKNHL